MRWRGERQSGNVEDRRGMTPARGGMAIGGGSAILLLILALVTGQNPLDMLGGLAGGGSAGIQPTQETGAVGAPADELGQSFDFTEMDSEKPIMDRRRDPHSASGADAEDYANARIRKAQLNRSLGELVTAPHCGLEIGDVIQYSDSLVNASALKARVAGIKTTMKRRHNQRALYEQRVTLRGL